MLRFQIFTPVLCVSKTPHLAGGPEFLPLLLDGLLLDLLLFLRLLSCLLGLLFLLLPH